VIEATRPDGNILHAVYDQASRLTAQVDALGHLTRFEYSPTGALTRRVNRRDKATSFQRDGADRVTSVTDPLGRISRMEYGLDDEALKLVRPSGAETTFSYNALLQLAGVVVSNDTGPAHMAAGVGARLVSVLGPTDPGRWAPWGSTVTLMRRWPEWVGVDEVTSAVDQALP
jgi:YD repeat-containing protein